MSRHNSLQCLCLKRKRCKTTDNVLVCGEAKKIGQGHRTNSQQAANSVEVSGGGVKAETGK